MITVTRKTTESSIVVRMEQGPVKKDYRSDIKTPIPFLNHMIEHIIWRSGINISVDVTLDRFDLAHLVCEDVGMTLGKAVAAYLAQQKGPGYGDGVGIIDEARAISAISFESRALLVFDHDGSMPSQTEGMNSEDLSTFLEGFVQGANCTLHISLERGENGHHIWEAIYRAVGIALCRALTAKAGSSDMTSGVAGKIEYTVEVE